MFLNNVQQVRSIEWGQMHLWDVRFPDAPSPFSDWFPATDYQLNSVTGLAMSQQFYMRDFKFPQSKGSPDLTFQVLDDEKMTLHEWYQHWFDEIYQESSGVLTLAECVRPVIVATLNRQRQRVLLETFYVFPDGAVNRSGSSNSDQVNFTMNFIIAGKN